MAIIESKTGIIKQPDVKIFNFLSDFTNFSRLIPSGNISNWSATPHSCQFDVLGIGHAGMEITEKIPYKLIKVNSVGSTPVNFQLWIYIEPKDANTSEVKVCIEPKVNPIILGMIKSHLQNLADKLIEQLEQFKF